MTPFHVRHVQPTDYKPGTAVQGHIEHLGDERLPPSAAVPLIAGLSIALWAAIYYATRGVMGL